MKFHALDSWRGICAVLVLLFHLDLASHFLLLPMVRNGGIGVDFFFVLSGFVIAHAYGGRLSDRASAVRFVVRRFGRLYPLHVFTLGIMVALELIKLAMVIGLKIPSGDPPFGGDNTIAALFGNLVLINGLGVFQSFTWNGPSWSISTEFYTYLLFLAVSFLGWKRQRAVSILIAVAAAIGLGINAYTNTLGTTTGGGLLSCIYGFFLGTLTYGVFRHLLDNKIVPPQWLEWVALGLVLAAFTYRPMLQESFRPLVFAAVVIIFAFERGPVSRVLLKRQIHHLGIISYSVYLIHFPLIAILNGAARASQSKLHVRMFHVHDTKLAIDIGGPYMMDLATIAFALVAIAIATWTYNHIEDPARHYFNRLSRRISSPPSDAVADSSGR
jgi:peptidoglycan/LPS O-acetylase OafA/YrhL